MKLSHLLRNILSIYFMLSIVAANNQQAITILGKNNVVLGKASVLKQDQYYPVSYTHLTLPTNREV